MNNGHQWRRGMKASLVAGVSTVALTATMSAGALAMSPPDNSDLEPNEIAMSDNMSHIANLPQPEALGGATGSDMAFQDDMVFIGSYNGFWVVDVADPTNPEIVTTVVCPGGQGDISVDGDLLFFAVDYARNNDTCQSESASSYENYFEGVRVFDISDVTNPEYVAGVPTACGSHTQSILPEDDRVLVYVSSYSPSTRNPYCQPPWDSVSVIDVPRDDPASAAVASTPNLFPDGGLSRTSGCHDVTVYPEEELIAGACMGDGIMMDVSEDPLNPVVTSRVRDTENFDFWHSATFNEDLDKVVYTDELGGGGRAICTDEYRDNQGANAIYSLSEDNELAFTSYFKMPRLQSDKENCVAHNGSLVPVKGKDIMVQSWYQGGVSMWDFTDAQNPEEFAWFERGPKAGVGGTWSTYYYNGYVYSSDITEGLDVLKVDDARIAGAEDVEMDTLNPQSQPDYLKGKGYDKGEGHPGQGNG